MTAEPEQRRIDAFIRSRVALSLAFAWGIAEATCFFIVPDVLLTVIASRELKPALKATVTSLLGALIGGPLMYAYGLHHPISARAFLDHIPAIGPALIAQVASQINDNGLLAVLLGPIRGIPYKVYAVEWGARGGELLPFILVSIPARYVRFFLASVVTRLIARLIEPISRHRAVVELTILAIVWISFYGFYFIKFER